MYQSVAHEGVALMGRAMGIPLYRLETKGTAHSINKDYIPTENDEVEDLYRLLQKIQVRRLNKIPVHLSGHPVIGLSGQYKHQLECPLPVKYILDK